MRKNRRIRSWILTLSDTPIDQARIYFRYRNGHIVDSWYEKGGRIIPKFGDIFA